MTPAEGDRRPAALSLRPASTADAGFFLWLEEVSMRDYAVALWGVWRPGTTVADFDPTGMRIVLAGDAPVGCLLVRREPQQLRVLKLYVAPGWRNAGVGAWALRTAIAEADAAGLPVRLTVLVTNPARRFYEREGFRLESETAERLTMMRPPQARLTGQVDSPSTE